MINNEDSNILQCFLAIAPYLIQFSVDDMGFAISDTEKIIFDMNPKTIKFDKDTYTGEKLQSDWALYKAMSRRERLIEEVDKELFGTAYLSIATPIIEQNKVVGCIEIYQSIERKTKLLEIANSMCESIKELNLTVQQVVSEAEELSVTSQQISNISKESNTKVSETDGIIKLVKRMSDKTNLIGFNASIEAAHAGIHGLGFAVVAEEVCNLAQSSSASINSIRDILDHIKKSVQSIDHSLEEMTIVSEHLAKALLNISLVVENLNKISDAIIYMAKDLTTDFYSTN